MGSRGPRTETVLHLGSPQEAGMDGARVRRIVERGRQWVEAGDTPSLVLLAARRGVVFLHQAFGTVTNESGTAPIRLDTLFNLASLSKVFTATAIMSLVEDGLLGLTRPVQDYIPEFTGKGKEDVLVWHLLTHTSGLRHEDLQAFMAQQQAAGAQVPPPEPTQHPWVNQFLWLQYRAPLWNVPGAEMSYCNFNYSLLAEIVRRLSGRAFPEVLHEKIFVPLGMTQTYADLPPALDGRVAAVPPDAPVYKLLPPPGLRVPAGGGGGVHGVAWDLALFGQTFLSGGRYGGVRMLSPATVREMTRNQIPGIPTTFFGESHAEASWGYGFQVKGNEKWVHFDGSLASPQTFGHGGGSGTWLWVDPVDDIVGVYLSVWVNMTSQRRDSIVHDIDLFQNLVHGAIAD